MRPKTPRKSPGPKPRTVPRAATKVCDAGHRQGLRWKPGDFCGPCHRAAYLAEQAERAIAEREGWAAVLGPPPAAMTIRCGDGSTITYTIPRGMGPARKRRRRR